MTLSICIACHNDSAELLLTLRSIRATAGSAPECVVVDDATINGSPAITADCGQVTLIRTKHRVGVGPARHLGALRATGEYLLFVDSHMRFLPGWYDAVMNRVVGRPNVVHCGVCLGLGVRKGVLNMDVNKPNATYYAAQWNMFGPDPNPTAETRGLMQVFENVWAQEQQGDDYDVSAVMGANYVVPREWYLKLNCGVHLHSYGGDEQELSLKTWLAGGSCKMLKQLRIGHVFRDAVSYRVRSGFRSYGGDQPTPAKSTFHVVRNKLFLILTLLPDHHASVLAQKLKMRHREYNSAVRAMEQEWRIIECERAANFTRQKVGFESFLQQFNIPFPTQ